MDDDTPVWYVSYGSNLSSARFDCYIRGGVPEGGQRDYEGCRDRTPPRARRATHVDGALYFAGHSLTWDGGMAFLDPDRPGTVPAAGYLIGAGQFADVCAQEMRRPVGSVDVPLATVVADGEWVRGDGHYDRLIHLGRYAGTPQVTFTAPHRLRPETTPSPPYLAMIANGIHETHGWPLPEARAYLESAITKDEA